MRSDPELALDLAHPLRQNFAIEETAAYSHSGNERNHLFLNQDGRQFLDAGGLSGLDDPGDGRSFAIFDFDRDGWQDFVTASINRPTVRLYRNRIGNSEAARQAGHMIAFRFVGGNDRAEPSETLGPRDGYGARVRLLAGDLRLVREHRCGEGLAAQNSATLLVGLGANERAEGVVVEWPSGHVQELGDLPAGHEVTVYEEPADSRDGRGFEIEPYRGLESRATIADRGTSFPVLPMVREADEVGAELQLITTMATWCPKCKSELPQLARLRDYFDADELAMHGLPADLEDDSHELAEYVDRFHPVYDMLLHLSKQERIELSSVFRQALRVDEVFPATVVTDRSGRILFASPGVPTVSDIEKLLRRGR